MGKRIENWIFKDSQRAFTLIELMLVLAVMAVLTIYAMGSLSNAQGTQNFNNQFEDVFSLLNNARTSAIAAKGMSGVTCTGGATICSPAHYGVAFVVGANSTQTLFADNNSSSGSYDAASGTTADPTIRQVTLQKNMQLCLFAALDTGSSISGTKLTYISGSTPAIFYTPLYADISFDATTAGSINETSNDQFFVVRVAETAAPYRCRQIRIHRLAGNPEVEICPALSGGSTDYCAQY